MFRKLGLLAFAILFLRGGWNQTNRAEHYSQQAAKAGLPVTADAVKASGYLMIACALGLQLPFLRRLAALGLALQLPLVTYIGHRFWEMDEPQRSQHMTHFLKNTTIMGGALFIAGSK